MPKTCVLVIGLDPFRVPGPWDPEPVAEAIKAGMAALADDGFDAEACLIGLDGSEDVESSIARALKSRAWDCVIVGGGIRQPEDQLALFESVINLIRRFAPQAAIAFNRKPNDLAEAITRAMEHEPR